MSPTHPGSASCLTGCRSRRQSLRAWSRRRLTIAHHLLDGHRGDARECGLGDGAVQHALATCSTASAERAAEQLPQDARLLLVHLTGDLGQVARVLKRLHAALVGKGDVLLLGLLLQVLSELHALLRVQTLEGLLGRLLVHVRRQLRGYLLESVVRLLVRDALPGWALVVASGEVLILLPLLATAEQLLEHVHRHGLTPRPCARQRC